jgi:hypothetical protein
MAAMDRRRAKETGRPHGGRKDRRRDSDRPSEDTPFHLFAVTAPLQKTKRARPEPRLNAVAGGTTMKKLVRMWSMKSDRELMALSKTKTLEAIVQQIQRPPKSILDKAKRLGLTIKRKAK